MQDFADLASDPQLQHNGLVTTMQHPRAGELKVVGHPVRFSATPGTIRIPPPLVGEHTDAVLGQLGYTAEQIAALREEGVI